MEEKMQSSRKDGELQILINAAVRARVLPQELSSMVHDIRHKPNLVLHQADRDVPDPWKLLLNTRTIVEKLYTYPPPGAVDAVPGELTFRRNTWKEKTCYLKYPFLARNRESNLD